MKEYAYFPGCSANSTGGCYTDSMEYVAEKIGLNLHTINGWSCCGTSAARVTGDDLMHSLAAYNMATSQQQYPGLDVVAPCAGCYSALAEGTRYARESEENRARISEIIEMDYQPTSNALSLLEVMCSPEVEDAIAAALSSKMHGLKVACYYGCVLTRGKYAGSFDVNENPTKMDKLLEHAGAQCVDWAFKTECCGASNHVITPKAARAASEKILRNATANGADCIVACCPLCWLNLDLREKQINKEYNTSYNIPVYYFTELLALCMGATPSQLGLKRHFVECESLAAEKIATLEELEAQAAAAAKAEAEAKAAKIAAAKAAKAARAAQQAQEVSAHE